MFVLLPATRAFADAANSPEAAENGFTTRLNQERASRGLQALATAGDLAALARQHSQDMAAAGHPYHDPNIRSEVQDWEVLGDNVGSGPSVDAIHQGFMNSQVHRDEILDPEYTQVGVGVAWAGNVLYVTEIFRLPRSAQPQAPPAPGSAPPAPAVVQRVVRTQAASRSAPATAATAATTTPPPPPPAPPTTVATAPEAPRTTDALAPLPAFAPRRVARSVPLATSHGAALAAAILVVAAAGAQLSVSRRQRRYASMKPSRSPSSTPLTLPTS